MVCFAIEMVLQIPERSDTGALERRVSHLMHHCNADYDKKQETKDALYFTVKICDEETVSLLRDFPTPFNVVSIKLLQTGEALYLHRKHHSPPPIPLLKDIYWLAKSTERWKVLPRSGQNAK